MTVVLSTVVMAAEDRDAVHVAVWLVRFCTRATRIQVELECEKGIPCNDSGTHGVWEGHCTSVGRCTGRPILPFRICQTAGTTTLIPGVESTSHDRHAQLPRFSRLLAVFCNESALFRSP